MTDNAASVFMVCHLAVRLSLQSAARHVINHRGRGERACYQGVLADDLYKVLTPPATSAELDRWESEFTNWWGLPHVLKANRVPNTDLIMRTCHEYVRQLMLSQAVHDPDALRAWLGEADRAAAER